MNKINFMVFNLIENHYLLENNDSKMNVVLTVTPYFIKIESKMNDDYVLIDKDDKIIASKRGEQLSSMICSENLIVSAL